ncbi:glycolipid sulfotransferase [Sorangium cellulosum]|uniref:Glycolipid sulfotransferase n=1 Tax=Sorangium cellulosum TaxID=56 RepID=A0A150SWD9_SORCE|nr:glycolipid sulfotransferase [Sorangium cellulosum]KYF97051.1 glycolipid sulfotransferase [Sorangium cellulosum]
MVTSDTLIPPTRIVRDYLNSSLVWNDFLAQGGFISGDIVVADPFKAGTTWTQRIIQQILDNGEEREEALSDTSPWLDSSFGDHAAMLAMLKAQREAGERRVLKSHLPADAVPIAAQARYIFVGRNGKDLGISFHNYLSQFSAETMDKINRIHAAWSGDPTRLVIPESMQEFFDRWLDTDGYGCCDLFDVVRSWWELRDEPNVLLVHYRRLKEDLRGQIVRVAGFIDVDPAGLRLDRIVEHCSFGYMRARAEQMAPFAGAHMRDPKAFFHKGPARDYRAEITPAQSARFDRLALEKLGGDCARWLETGEERPGASAGGRRQAA